MTPTPRAVETELDNLLSFLIEAEIALYAMPLTRGSGVVTWHSYRPGESFLGDRGRPSVADYRRWIENGDFSAILFDGSLLQFTYEFSGSTLVRHRLAYIPVPFEMDEGLLARESILDVVDIYTEGHVNDVLLRSAIRFDFDLEASGSGHPAVHLTINSPECRIACVAPVRTGHFVDFVFRHFYPLLWKVHPYLHRLPKGGLGGRMVTPEEAGRFHIAWQF